MWWKRFLKKKHLQRPAIAEINIWHLQALFNNFRRILILNNAVLEEMTRLERTLGGEFIFDKKVLENSVQTLSSRVHHVTYNLNALTGNGFVELYDSYQKIRAILDDILTGSTRTLSSTPVLSMNNVGWEHEQLVGVDLVCLAELQHHPGIKAACGFVVTTEGTRALHHRSTVKKSFTAGEVRASLDENFRQLLDGETPGRFSVVVTGIDDHVDEVKEIACFFLVPDKARQFVDIVTDPPSFEQLPFTRKDNSNEDLPVPDHWVDQYVHSLEQIIGFILSSVARDDGELTEQIVVFVRSSPVPSLTGTVETRRGGKSAPDRLIVIAREAEMPDFQDTFQLRRTYPFELIQSKIASRPENYRFNDGLLATSQSGSEQNRTLGRGSALIDDRTLKNLAETSMALERLLGMPVTIEWEILENGTCHITRLFQLQAAMGKVAAHELAKAEAAATILCEGGQMVQSGVGAGLVVHVSDEMSQSDFPAGAVAVARFASPQLTPVLQRAAAVITEYGSATGHLATVARELRLPALFGVPQACSRLSAGTEVTVHAGENRIYQGILDILLHKSSEGVSFSPFDHEYRTLRRLLRFIMPLHLVNPDSENFTPAGCRTFHDIIHFCHEKAVDELAHFQERRPGLGSIRTRRMDLGVPMDIRVLDIGEGMTTAHGATPVPADVSSKPFAEFLGGLLQPRAWADNLPSLGLRDIVSSMPRSMGMLAGSADALGENLAIVSRDYMNVSLRLGFHFSVIDAHIGSDDSRNYVYFRFVGGLADLERRGRRARFIHDILKTMDFKVSIKGDLVIGRIKSEHPPILRAALSVLGALTAFSRQRDTGLHSEEEGAALFHAFSGMFLDDFQDVVADIYGPLPEQPEKSSPVNEEELL